MENVSMEMINEKLDALMANLAPPKEIFTAQEAAAYLCISYDMIRRYARTGMIRSAQNGKSLLFRKEWLDDWMEKGGTR